MFCILFLESTHIITRELEKAQQVHCAKYVVSALVEYAILLIGNLIF